MASGQGMFCVGADGTTPKPLEMLPMETPEPGPGEVLLRVDVAGLCHSDLHILDGAFAMEAAYKKMGMPFQLALSHEIGGTVIATGDGVDSVTVGKEYVLYPWLGCGDCIQCNDSNSDEVFCMGRTKNYGVNNNGGFASHLIVPDAKYLVDPGNVPMPLAATYTCSGLTAYSALRKASLAMQGPNSSPTGPGRSLLIIGAGGLGLHGIGWAKILCPGCKVVVAEPDHTKHPAAKEAGADEIIDTSGDDALELIQAATGGGPHAVIDFVGMPVTSGLGRSALRKGGTQVQVGLFGGPMEIDVGSFATAHKHLMGNFVGTLDEFIELMEYVKSGEKKDIPCETRPIEHANEAIADLRAGTIVGRCVLTHAPREPSM